MSRVREEAPEQTESSDDSDRASSSESESDDSDTSDSDPSDSDSEGEDCRSDPELIRAPVEEDGTAHHWNTPEGWAKVRSGIDEFIRLMSCPGHTCAICGERKEKCKRITRKMLMTWCIVQDPEKLDDALYTQYPKKHHSPNVSPLMSTCTA